MSLPLTVDILICLALLIYLIDGYRRGLLLLALELLGTFLTFYVAFIAAAPVGKLLHRFFEFSESLERVIGFVTIWIAIQAIYVIASSLLYPLIPKSWRESIINRGLGIIPSFFKGIAMVGVILTLIVILPFQSQLRPAISQSRLGGPIVNGVQTLEQQFAKQYSTELTKSLTFLTTSPIVSRIHSPSETVDLHFTKSDGKPDPVDEAEMLALANKERVSVGLKPLAADPALRDVARAHAQDMLTRGYFSHDTPEGKDPFDRMEAAHIQYLTAGENLAFAPTVQLAHIGLMNSPKHKENILYPDFGQVGIGVIDAGIYGKMFVQEFRD